MFKKKKRCWKCGRFLGENHWIYGTWWGLRKKYSCVPACLPSGKKSR